MKPLENGCRFGSHFNIDFYAPRMPADPFARSVFLRSLHSRSVLRQRHANAHTLGGTQGLGPRTPRKGGGGAPSAPLGPMGAIGIIPKLFRMECSSDTIKSDSRSRGFKGPLRAPSLGEGALGALGPMGAVGMISKLF